MADLILKEKTVDMIIYLDDLLRNYPKEQRHPGCLIPRTRACGYEMLEIATDIGGGFYNKNTLSAFKKRKNAINAYIDYSLKRRYISPHQHRVIGAMIDELGKINYGLTVAYCKRKGE